MTPITGHHLIAGQPSAQGAATLTSINPRTRTPGDVKFHNATPGEIDRALIAASEAFRVTRLYPAAKIADFLDRAAEEINALGDELLQTADWETALGLPRLTGERGRTTSQLQAFARLLREGSYVEAIIDTALPDRQPPRPDIRRMLFPLGPVAVFSASNFPFAFSVAGGDTASAWAAGCPVVVKAHPGHPATSELTAQAINRAVTACGFPPGWFSLLQGESVEVGQALIQHPLLEAVGFTGSLRAGRAIYDTASRRERPIPVYAEMGSVNPTVILPGALRPHRMDALAEGLAISATLGSGQFCTNPGLILLVNEAPVREFIDLYRQKMSAREPGVLLNAQIERGLTAAVAGTMGQGSVDCLVGGAVVEGDSYRYENTVLETTGAALLRNPALQNEHFGPVTLFAICADENELLAVIDSLHGSLTASIHAEPDEAEAARPLYERLREKAGRLLWNGFPTGVEVVYAMQHGGPYPATTAPATTSVGMTAIKRFLRPVAFQNLPDVLLPPALQNANLLNIWRIVNGEMTKAAG